jgi:PhnB protein
MTVHAVAHLNFRGDARAALEFYQSVFGGNQMVISYKDAGNVQNPAEADQVMWGQVAAESGFRVMAYDVPSRTPWNPGEIPFFVSVRGNAADEITRYWEKLSEGATVLQPLAPSGWSPLYGMLKDRFGVTWVLDVEVAYTAVS